MVIGSLSYSPSRVLKAIDPVAYRCGFDDFMEWNGITEEDE